MRCETVHPEIDQLQRSDCQNHYRSIHICLRSLKLAAIFAHPHDLRVHYSQMTNLTAVGECSADQTHIWADVLAQSVTGELIGAMNYETLAGLYR